MLKHFIICIIAVHYRLNIGVLPYLQSVVLRLSNRQHHERLTYYRYENVHQSKALLVTTVQRFYVLDNV